MPCRGWQKLVDVNKTIVTNFTYSIYLALFTLGLCQICNKKKGGMHHGACKSDGQNS